MIMALECLDISCRSFEMIVTAKEDEEGESLAEEDGALEAS